MVTMDSHLPAYFILITIYKVCQDWRAVKGRTAVRCQHAADHQLISKHYRLRTIVVGGTFRLIPALHRRQNTARTRVASPLKLPLSSEDCGAGHAIPRYKFLRIALSLLWTLMCSRIVSLLRPFLEHQLMSPAGERPLP